MDFLKEFYHSIQINDSFLAILLDSNLNILEWNQGAVIASGFSFQEVVNKPFSIIGFSEGEIHRIETFFQEEGKNESIRICIKHKTNPGKVYRFPKIVISKEGKPVYLLLGQDVSAEVLLENSLCESNFIYQSIVNSLPFPIVVIGKNRIIQAINNAGIDAGFKIGEYCWKSCTKMVFVPQENKDYFYENKSPLPDTHCTFCESEKALKSFEIQHTIKSIDDRVYEIFWVPINQSTGLFLHYFMDITDRVKLTENYIESARRDFQGIVTGRLAHDFNNTLTGIVGYLDLLLLDEKNEQTRSIIEKIIDTTEKSTELTRKMLDISSKGKKFDVPVSVNIVLENVLRVLKNKLDQMNIDGMLQYNPETFWVSGDSDQLEKAILNLCMNSVEAMSDGGELKIRFGKLIIDGNECVEIQIDDNGAGMSPEILEKAYHPFFTTKSEKSNTDFGLGLPVAQGIVKNHDGKINIISDSGVGTRVKIILPAIKIQNEEIICLENKETVDFSEKIQKVVVIDDEIVIRTTLKAMLEKMGYQVYCAESGTQGLKLFFEEPERIGLVVCDIILPDLNGQVVYEKIIEKGFSPRIIFTSGYIETGDFNLKLNPGKIDFISKPFRLKEFMALIIKKGEK